MATEGVLRTFTIVTFAAPGIPVPYVAGVVDCAGTSVRENIVNCDPTPETVKLGMKVRLVTVPVGDGDDDITYRLLLQRAGDAVTVTGLPIDAVQSTMDQAKGSWKFLLGGAALAGSFGAAASWLVSHLGSR